MCDKKKLRNQNKRGVKVSLAADLVSSYVSPSLRIIEKGKREKVIGINLVKILKYLNNDHLKVKKSLFKKICS